MSEKKYPSPTKYEGVTVNTRHVDGQEAMQVADPSVGDGTLKTAPWVKPSSSQGKRASFRTLGISPKAKLAAALTASAGTLSAIVITALVTGELDRSALAGGLSGVAAAGIAFLGAYLGGPGDVVCLDD